ncbi:MAG: DUF6089 family protein [Bacteroidota bacterium]|nr:DUF6089 family protein [Bacteroidota bacterium]
MKLIRLFIFGIFGLISFQLSAQDEYKAEIGIEGGGSYYLGEANSHPFSNMRMAYGGFFRYRFDQRLAARVELVSATVAGQGINDNSVYAGDLCGEFNFFDLEKNQYKQFSKTFSPYIFAGIGMMTGVYDGQTSPEFSLTFGVGLKVKLVDRWNLNIQWSNRVLLADNLEGTGIHSTYNNSNSLNGSNILNNDLLSTFTVGLSFDIWKKHCDCENSSVIKDRHKYKH